MRISPRVGKVIAEGVFYLAILTLLVSRAASANVSHDENQFIAPGQFLAYEGLAPYVDYPFTHMPYAVPLYALSALASDYDLLAGRLLSALFWFGNILLMAAISRRLITEGSTATVEPRWGRLLWEFVVVLAFMHDATVEFALRTALNHSMAVFFSLLGMLFFVRGIRQDGEAGGAALLSGACAAAAGLTRFNHASLVVVLFAGWVVLGALLKGRSWQPLAVRFGAGALMASLPALGLAALAPRQFYYANAVYVRLNTVYYVTILHRTGMDLASKLGGFISVLLAEPMQMCLYGVLVVTAIVTLVRAKGSPQKLDLGRLAVAAAAFTMWMTAFAPTPLLLQYLAAPLPYLLILLAAIDIRLPRFEFAVRAVGAVAVGAAVLTGMIRRNPLADLRQLAQPQDWPPVQVHDLAEDLRHLVPEGRVLTLQSMVPMEAGLQAYPFTASGPFTWRTSLLLTSAARAEYGVTSPEELPGLLDAVPPEAILVGFEEPNPGFERKDIGGLEKPFSDYAVRNGYTAERLLPPFWPRGLTLWIRP